MSRFPQRDVSFRTPGPSVHAPGDGLVGNYSAVVHAAPSGGTCKVVIPALSLTNYYTAVCSTAFTASAGDRVLVAFDEQKQPWVLSPEVWQAGDVKLSAVSTAPSGWLTCDGTSYLRTTYPALFAAIGTAYGSVDGTHFNVPDLRGRVPLGAGTGTAQGASAWTLGSQPTTGRGGEETHVLVDGEMPSTVTVSPGGHWTGVAGPTPSGSTYWYPLVPAANSLIVGSSAAHNNMQPVSVVNYIIKT